jgi:hypothetical protein
MKIIITFILIFIVNIAFGQKNVQIDSLFLAQIAKQIKTEILNQYKNDSISIDANCYYEEINGEKFRLSCFYVKGNLGWIGDINKDGENDVILEVYDEGLGGGGSMYGYDYYVIYLKDKKIIGKDIIFGGGENSFAHLRINLVSNHIIYANLFENTRFEADTLKDKQLEFIWHNNKLVEKSYLNCPLATINKQIFKSGLLNIKRNISVNDMYEEEQRETLLIDTISFSASYTGCKTPELWFFRHSLHDPRIENDIRYKRDKILDNIKFLKENTVFESVFESIMLDIEQNGVKNGTIALPNDWLYYMGIDNSSYGGGHKDLRFFIRLFKENDALDYWKRIKR